MDFLCANVIENTRCTFGFPGINLQLGKAAGDKRPWGPAKPFFTPSCIRTDGSCERKPSSFSWTSMSYQVFEAVAPRKITNKQKRHTWARHEKPDGVPKSARKSNYLSLRLSLESANRSPHDANRCNPTSSGSQYSSLSGTSASAHPHSSATIMPRIM